MNRSCYRLTTDLGDCNFEQSSQITEDCNLTYSDYSVYLKENNLDLPYESKHAINKKYNLIEDIKYGDVSEKTDESDWQKDNNIVFKDGEKSLNKVGEEEKSSSIQEGEIRDINGDNTSCDLAIDNIGEDASLSCQPFVLFLDGEMKTQTHKALFRFIPRHIDELELDVGDPVCVDKECDDLWYEGINLVTGEEGCFPVQYVCRTSSSPGAEQPTTGGGKFHMSKFKMSFLGSVEVKRHKGTEILCQAMQMIVKSRRLADRPPALAECTLNISCQGIHLMNHQPCTPASPRPSTMRDSQHFFALTTISFCGYHPKNQRYFGFITTHPSEMRFACHVFVAEDSNLSINITSAIGQAFERFHQEFLDHLPQTEDIYLE